MIYVQYRRLIQCSSGHSIVLVAVIATTTVILYCTILYTHYRCLLLVAAILRTCTATPSTMSTAPTSPPWAPPGTTASPPVLPCVCSHNYRIMVVVILVVVLVVVWGQVGHALRCAVCPSPSRQSHHLLNSMLLSLPKE